MPPGAREREFRCYLRRLSSRGRIVLKRLLVTLAVVVAGCATPSFAHAGSNLFFGFSDDGPKWGGAAATEPARNAGAGAFRVTLHWVPGETNLTAEDATELSTAVTGTSGLR